MDSEDGFRKEGVRHFGLTAGSLFACALFKPIIATVASVVTGWLTGEAIFARVVF